MLKSTRPKSATSYKDTAFGILPRSKVVVLEQEGEKKTLQYIIKLSEEQTAITPRIILDVHRVGFGFIFPDWTVKFRIVDVTIGEYEPPHYSRIPELVKNLCADLSERLKHLPSLESQEKFLAETIIQTRSVYNYPHPTNRVR